MTVGHPVARLEAWLQIPIGSVSQRLLQLADLPVLVISLEETP